MGQHFSKKSGNDLVSRIVFTILILIVCRFGSFIPIPGIDSIALSSVAAKNQSGILGMFNMLSGGSLGRMSIFALAIMPYITASIIIQLMSVAYKPLENLKKEGEVGKRKVNQLSRYLTVLLASFQAYGVAISLESIVTNTGPVVILAGFFFRVTTVITLVVGTMLLMWLGEQITQRGIGNGTSLIIFIGIISGVPSAIISVFELSRKGALSPLIAIAVCIGVVVLIAIIIFFEKAQRKLLVQYPKRQVGNKIYGGEATHMPLKLNTSGVIPPIFASSILLFPATLANFSNSNSETMGMLTYYLGHGKPVYILLYVALIMFFSFFYTAIVFNSEETANNLRKYGAYIPGKRPGKNTSDYFDYILTRLTVIGGIYLSVICVIPELLMNKYVISLSLGGTSFLIVVNVVLDTMTQIQTYLFSTKYEGLMKKVKLKNSK
ncbi:preprotein translocase subunit SecY [Rickettsia conorii subsp. heilongjiangensis]|uniref:Protein translocase subunit SecY n=1 Tax=Rickettsia conorii subsp. heilongjiangensis TaxID=226665 RepID=A0AAD1GIW7_RICCR|nr:preprotein translocase subunit SecY [Rickettsia conorii]AEK74987.1 preprotein translocase subunit SecY [Rickettsia conorii subsp. heilongjiangensis 054]BBM91719.1 preprotein translocase subunit SecY [Rickettsia conorii subsp. heilongjiangensis]BBM92928.1 preprotein translocase subunit SecY [Rickettsia conorii subsp. heilongjiangensis]BBM94137.1 preprotein translocase subunit SecY [Rickettsia conorii subsp. heilongjiangensis]BBM95346.1 preprotein translocase subunit SecY [Rickettsia conorii 